MTRVPIRSGRFVLVVVTLISIFLAVVSAAPVASDLQSSGINQLQPLSALRGAALPSSARQGFIKSNINNHAQAGIVPQAAPLVSSNQSPWLSYQRARRNRRAKRRRLARRTLLKGQLQLAKRPSLVLLSHPRVHVNASNIPSIQKLPTTAVNTSIRNSTSTVAYARAGNATLVNPASGNVTQPSSKDSPRNRTGTTGTLNGLITKTQWDGKVTYHISRHRAVPSFEPGKIQTNISALDSSLSVLRHNSFPDSELFCYIRGVCRLGNGEFLLPAWMQRHSDKLARCGLDNIMYVLHEENAAELNKDGTTNKTITIKGFPRPFLLVTDEFRDMDIIGSDPPRPEWNELVDDLTPRILLADMFLRPQAYNKSITKPRCYKKSDSTDTTETTQNCTDEIKFPKNINASLLVNVGLSSVKDYKWPKGVIRLLRNGFDGNLLVTDLADIYGFRFRNHASCFRSILTTNASLESFKSGKFMVSDNFMFRSNALSREPVLNLEKADGRRCDLKVLILDRIEEGKILGLKIFKDALTVLNMRLAKSFPTSSVMSEAVYFQNISFHEQISVMQEADIVVASHSEMNSNMPFLRPNASFFEIVPFGIPPSGYRKLAEAYDVQYHHINAFPDSELFTRCIDHYNDGIQEERELLLKHWRNAAGLFLNINTNTSINGAGKNSSISNASIRSSDFYLPEDGTEESYGELRNMRTCAALQRVSANLKELAKVVFKAGMDKCGIRSEMAQKSVFF